MFLVTALLVVACGGRAPIAVPSGVWGGEHVSVTVSEAGGSIALDCAHGKMDEPLVLDSNDRFEANGSYVREHGGPIVEGEPEERHPASYIGRVQGSQLTISIRLSEDGTQLGPFTASRGRPAQLFKCL